ncbi:MAG: hypothetical protein DRI61_12800 [Chloroflexi bacterium]|nr:MAG: hypothetical protein DRI61_12800 [Chloroflexota bacterium]
MNDRDGVLRPQDGNLDGVFIADIGAYEFITGTTTFTITTDVSGTMSTDDGRVRIEWPTASVTCTVVMTYTPLGRPGENLPTFLSFGGIAFDLQATDCNGDPVEAFLKPLTLTIRYIEELLPEGMDENSLELYKWDADKGEWVKLEVISRDPVNNTITVRLERLCEFDLVGVVSEKQYIYLPLVLRNYGP